MLGAEWKYLNQMKSIGSFYSNSVLCPNFNFVYYLENTVLKICNMMIKSVPDSSIFHKLNKFATSLICNFWLDFKAALHIRSHFYLCIFFSFRCAGSEWFMTFVNAVKNAGHGALADQLEHDGKKLGV